MLSNARGRCYCECFAPSCKVSVMVTSGVARRDDLASPPLLSLESRLGLLRRRRRVSFLKQLLAVCPLVVGMSLLLFAAVGGASSLR